MARALRWRPLFKTTALWSWLIFGAIIRLGASFLLAFVALLFFVWIARGVARGATQSFDAAIIEYFITHQPPWLRDPVYAVTFLANGATIGGVALFIGLLLALRRRSAIPLIELLIVTVGGWMLIEALKLIFMRERPELRMLPEPGLSFPSGHAFFGIAFYGFLAYRLAQEAPPAARRLTWLVVGLLALLVATSRVLLGVHYPSDVLAGLLVGLCWLWGSIHLPRLLRRAEWNEWRGQRIEILKTSLGALKPDEERDMAIRHQARELLTEPTVGLRDRVALRTALAADALYNRIAPHWSWARKRALGPAMLSLAIQGTLRRLQREPDARTLEIAKAVRRLLWA
ncbi:MAG TPA: phosphatase PAP2 family protein [Fimbriimonadaceae bacterium]|nr:phosphatase PAP2 family protein [Fimbriimonadaceae bacterium]